MNNAIKAIFRAFALGAFLLGASAFAVDRAEIEAIVGRLSKELKSDSALPGFSVAVLKKGEHEPVTMAFGTARVENDVPMTPASVFKVGSLTKVYTATLIHKLIEDGRLDYTTTIDRFYPEFPNGSHITVRHLLTHTSGIMEMLRLEAVQANMTKPWAPDELIAMVGAQPPFFAPGTNQMYCNTGYLILARIVEKVTGQTYEEQLRDVIFGKLGMKSLQPGTDTAVVSKMVGGYTSSPAAQLWMPMMASIAIAKGTGNLLGTPCDIVRLVNLGEVLKNNVFDTLPLAPLVLDDGKSTQYVADNGGWSTVQSELDGCTLFIFGDPKITVLGKLGSFPGFGTVYFYDRQTSFAVAISVNNERKITDAMLLGARILEALRAAVPPPETLP
jgi:D-alanyl-D-alanine carboxypeptidase